jgi:hypothetical protein
VQECYQIQPHHEHYIGNQFYFYVRCCCCWWMRGLLSRRSGSKVICNIISGIITVIKLVVRTSVLIKLAQTEVLTKLYCI